jgi:hypothetical protein
MKKFRLRLDDLAVVSFSTQAADAGRGTVHGHDSDVSAYGTCAAWTKCGDCAYTTTQLPTDPDCDTYVACSEACNPHNPCIPTGPSCGDAWCSSDVC